MIQLLTAHLVTRLGSLSGFQWPTHYVAVAGNKKSCSSPGSTSKILHLNFDSAPPAPPDFLRGIWAVLSLFLDLSSQLGQTFGIVRTLVRDQPDENWDAQNPWKIIFRILRIIAGRGFFVQKIAEDSEVECFLDPFMNCGQS